MSQTVSDQYVRQLLQNNMLEVGLRFSSFYLPSRFCSQFQFILKTHIWMNKHMAPDENRGFISLFWLPAVIVPPGPRSSQL
jgi:hypothetical protein